METNPFAPSQETDYASYHPDAETSPFYYVVSPVKFLTLFFATFGIYFVYWNYKQWKIYSDRTKLDCWPIARTIFAVVYIHSLFSVMKSELNDKNADYEWNNTLGATVIVVIMLSSRVLDIFVKDEMLLVLTQFAVWGSLAYFLLQAQRVANILSSDPNGRSNSRFTLANFVWIILGSILWAVMILGMILIALGE